MEITQELVKKLFEYHQEGYLIWKKSPRGNVPALSKAGHLFVDIGGKSRQRITVNRKRYFAAQLIFLFHNGFIPKFVDHKDRNPSNDKIDNLRAANRFQNARNKTVSKNSASQYLGVYLRKKSGKWISYVRKNGKSTYLGDFVTEEEAALAYNSAAKEVYGEFANLNIL